MAVPGSGVVLHEGRNRQIRRMAEAVGLEVVRLVRVRIGSLRLGDLPTGAWRGLSAAEVAALRGTAFEQTSGSRDRRAGRAGKSTVAERLARELGYFYFDTGVLYRAVAVRASTSAWT